MSSSALQRVETKADDSTRNEASEPMPAADKAIQGAVGGQQGPEPRAGQLTAGEWTDVLNWGEWLDKLNGKEGADALQVWGMYPLHRLVIEVRSGDSPAADVKVAVKHPDGEVMWESRTDLQGRAYAYPLLFEQPGRSTPKTAYQVEAFVNGQSVASAAEVELSTGQPVVLDIGSTPALSNKVDLMLVVDTTGSMADELQYLSAELKDVVTRAAEQSGDRLAFRLSANFYRDHEDEYVVRSYPFTEEVDEVVRQMSAQSAAGGGDYPEAVDEALQDALYGHEWSEQARARLLLLVLDAPPHDDRKSLSRMRELTAEAARMGVRIIPVASSGVDKSTEYLLRTLAVATGGSYVFLTNDSGIGNDHIEPDIDQYEVRPLNDLLVELILRNTQQQ